MLTTALGMQPLGLSLYYLLFGREPSLPVDVEFGLWRENQKGSLGKSTFISQLRRRLKFSHNKAKQMAKAATGKAQGAVWLKVQGC